MKPYSWTWSWKCTAKLWKSRGPLLESPLLPKRSSQGATVVFFVRFPLWIGWPNLKSPHLSMADFPKQPFRHGYPKKRLINSQKLGTHLFPLSWPANCKVNKPKKKRFFHLFSVPHRSHRSPPVGHRNSCRCLPTSSYSHVLRKGKMIGPSKKGLTLILDLLFRFILGSCSFFLSLWWFCLFIRIKWPLENCKRKVAYHDFDVYLCSFYIGSTMWMLISEFSPSDSFRPSSWQHRWLFAADHNSTAPYEPKSSRPLQPLGLKTLYFTKPIRRRRKTSNKYGCLKRYCGTQGYLSQVQLLTVHLSIQRDSAPKVTLLGS